MTDTTTTAATNASEDHAKKRRPRSFGSASVSVRTLIVAIVITALIAVIGVLSWLLIDRTSELDARNQHAQGEKHVEQIALDYAVGAADMDYKDLGAWRSRLTKNTSPELSNKLTQAATSMEQIIVPLQWVSTSSPLTAKVRSESGGIYVIDTFVSVLTKNTQTPDGIQSTATYSITVDSNANWQITDVGGIAAVVGQK